jgi:hypothetical protein
LGCAAVSPKIEQGDNSDADTALVMAKVDKVAERIVGVSKEVQQSIKSDVKATRDAVQTTTQQTGMGDWIVLCVVVALRGADVWETKINKRNGNGVAEHENK